MLVNQKDWSCPKKQKARWETIISQYRSAFEEKLPANKQYWTICGQCATSDGEPLHGCEIWQLLEHKLITPQQFHGVEINPAIHNLNVKAFPEMNWHNNDFYRAMVVAQSNGAFNPAIVNADLPQTPDGGAGYIAKCMAFLTATADEVIFVANLILRQRFYTTKDGDYVIGMLNQYPQFRYAMKEGDWTFCNNYYAYAGAGETGGRTWMGSFVFVKQ
jgi:hypothetical protein